MRKQTVTLLASLLSVVVTGVVSAREHTLVIGAEDGWQANSTIAGLERISGRHGHADLALIPFRNEVDPDTELLLHFDHLPLTDDAGRFAVRAPGAELSATTRRSGRQGLLVDDPGDVITLDPVVRGMFSPGTEWGSFTLEFWLYPATLAPGERVLTWEGREGATHGFRNQELTVEVRDRRLRFSFVNFFVPPDGSPLNVTLEGDAGLVPRRWAHHQVRFDAETALLEYLVDGRTAAVTHVSATGREDGTVYFPRIAAMASGLLRLVPSFTGAIDEVRLLRRVEPDASLLQFDPRGGVFESAVIDLGSPGARVTGLDALTSKPAMTDVFLYLRVSNSRFGDREVSGEWLPVDPASPFEAMTGRYAQLRAELKPDARTSESPVLSEIHLTYVPDPPPTPPVGLVAIPRDGMVELSWAPGLQEDIRGYLVYYGEQPGRYHGTRADNGASPLDVGEATTITLTGLENGTLYYFAVSAYDVAGVHSATELSAEVAARPAKVHR